MFSVPFNEHLERKKKWLFNTLYVHSKKGGDVHQV